MDYMDFLSLLAIHMNLLFLISCAILWRDRESLLDKINKLIK